MYKVGIFIATRFRVLVSSGYNASKFNDLQLARLQFSSMLLRSENAIVDVGYSDAHYFVNART